MEPIIAWKERLRRHADLLAGVLLACLVALFFWRILTPDPADRVSFPPGDFSHQFWAFAAYEARELAAGRVPLWNPYTFAGCPFWADIQSAVFYPPSLVTLLLSVPLGLSPFPIFALEVEAVAHFVLAAIFAYLFARRVLANRGAALLVAVTFTFGGYLTGYPSQQLAVLEVDVWLPLVLLFIDRALLLREDGSPPEMRPRAGRACMAWASLCWGAALLAGHPQSAMLVFYAAAAYYLFVSLAYAPRPAMKAIAGRFAFMMGVGFAVGAVGWLPGLEYMLLSVRSGGFYEKMSGGFPLHDVIQLLLPGIVSFYSPLYVGILPLILAVWAALGLRTRETTFWGLAAATALLLSFGGNTFLYSPFYLLVPGFGIFRGQERAAFIFGFALAVLAGYGLRALLEGGAEGEAKEGAERGLRRAANLLVAVSALLIALFFYGLNSANWLDDSPFNALLGGSVLLFILAVLARVVLHLKGHVGAPVFISAAVALAAFDLFTVNWSTNVYGQPPEYHTAPPAVVEAIRADSVPGEVFRAYNEYRVYDNYGVPFEIEDMWGASPLRLSSYDTFVHTLPIERAWELLNVKYVVTWRGELYLPSDVVYSEQVAENDTTYVHRLREVGPRAWLVGGYRIAGDGEALEMLSDPGFPRWEVALLPPGSAVEGLPDGGEGARGEVRFVSREPGRVVLDVEAESDALLVLGEIYYPGWRAAVDGAKTPVLRADYVLRAVRVPAGAHRVEMVFAPPTWYAGLALSILGLLTAAVAVVISPRAATHNL